MVLKPTLKATILEFKRRFEVTLDSRLATGVDVSVCFNTGDIDFELDDESISDVDVQKHDLVFSVKSSEAAR